MDTSGSGITRREFLGLAGGLMILISLPRGIAAAAELGWTEPRPWKHQAIARDDPWLARFAALAAELQMAIAVTYLELWPTGGPRNSLTLFDRAGRPVLTHAKAHLCDWGPEGELTAGDALDVAQLDTAAGPVTLGALICYPASSPRAPAR